MLSSEVTQSLKSYGHFSDLGVGIALGHRHVGFFGKIKYIHPRPRRERHGNPRHSPNVIWNWRVQPQIAPMQNLGTFIYTVISKTWPRLISSPIDWLKSVTYQLHARMLSSFVTQWLKSYGHFSLSVTSTLKNVNFSGVLIFILLNILFKANTVFRFKIDIIANCVTVS